VSAGPRSDSFAAKPLAADESAMAATASYRTEAPPPPPAAARASRVAPFGGMRTRVLLSFLALLVISTAASVLVLRQVLLSRIGDQVQSSLTQKVESFDRLSRQSANPQTGEPFGGRLERIFGAYFGMIVPVDHGALVAFIDGSRYRARAADVGASELVAALGTARSVTAATTGEVATSNGPGRYVAVPISGRDDTHGVLVVGALLNPERAQVESAVRIAIGVSIVVMLLASLFIWLAAGRAIAPLQALAGAARSITESDLSRRLSIRGSDEIAQLGRTFNEMLDRLDIAFASQRAFMADVSHELRTPITVIRGHLETLGDDPVERREALAIVRDELGRMGRLVDDLLILARSSRPDFLRVEPLDLDLLTADLFAKASRLADRRWRLERTGIGLLQADPQRLTQAVMNLAENAARHTDEGDEIALGSSISNGEARLWVRDTGSGIDAADAERIFERFAQSDRAEGAGLGLAIVRAIAEAHGGRVELDSALGAGSTFAIVVPAEPATGE
jgi:signal transduction histidine kinase